PDGTTSFLPQTSPGSFSSGCFCEALPTHTYGVNTADEVAVGNKRTSYFLRYEHQLTDNLKVYGQVLAGENRVSNRRESISFILTWAPRVFADNAYLPAGVASAIAAQGGFEKNSTETVPSVPFAEFGINDGAHGLPES